MRGQIDLRHPMFFAIDIEYRIRSDHPLRPIKAAVDSILQELSPLFDSAYAKVGRPSVSPEVLLRSLLLQCLYTVRNETQLVERIDTDLLFRWFCGLDPAEPIFDATAFTHNRPRLDRHGITAAFFDAVTRRAINAGLTSDDHFSVDGTLIESYASIKSFKPVDETDDQEGSDPGNGFKPRNPEVNFHGQRRSNKTHRSRTDPEARLYKKGDGQGAKLYHMGHTFNENRHGMILAVTIGGMSRTRLVGRWKLKQQLELTAAAYNLVRMRKLLAT